MSRCVLVPGRGLLRATGAMIAMVLGTAAAAAEPAAPTLAGTWIVKGCTTSPNDPADCARGKITFESKRWSIELPCCKRASNYVVVSATAERITIASAGVKSVIRIDADGAAHWTPGGLGGRVGELMFVREP